MTEFESRFVRLNKYIVLAISMWTLIVVGLFARDAWHLRQTIKDLAATEARTHLKKDKATRLWAASHGGVYVPATEKTPPNTYLSHIPERDIDTPSGTHLTLLNPAYMLRHMAEHFSGLFRAKTHITSLKYFRVETSPDDWERAALHAFEKGQREVMEYTKISDEPYLRMMQPLKTESGCLKCHGFQGYKVGNIRGGLSVSIPMVPYWQSWRREMAHHVISFAVLWCLGVAGLIIANNHISKQLHRRNHAEKLLRIEKDNYQALVDNSLTGIYVSQNGKIVFANSQFAKIHGFDLDEMIGMDILDLVHPDERALIAERIKQRYQGSHELSSDYHVRCLTKDGNTIWVRRRNTLTAYDGRPAILGNEINVTDKKITEAELKASERQFKLLADRLLVLQETERHQFADQIHENYAQFLSAIKLQLESALNTDHSIMPLKTTEQLKSTVSHIQREISDVRGMVTRYGPIGLNHLGVLNILSKFCEQVPKFYPMMGIQMESDIDEGEIPDLLKVIIFRISEQACCDIAVQNYADTVKIKIEKKAGNIVMIVEAKGRFPESLDEFSEAPQQKELAILALKRRVKMYGGSLTYSQSGSILLLTASWPTCCRYPKS